jgi:hypothetical protein
MMLLDAYAWGRMDVESMGYREFGNEGNGIRPLHLRTISGGKATSSVYEARRGERLST